MTISKIIAAEPAYSSHVNPITSNNSWSTQTECCWNIPLSYFPPDVSSECYLLQISSLPAPLLWYAPIRAMISLSIQLYVVIYANASTLSTNWGVPSARLPLRLFWRGYFHSATIPAQLSKPTRPGGDSGAAFKADAPLGVGWEIPFQPGASRSKHVLC